MEMEGLLGCQISRLAQCELSSGKNARLESILFYINITFSLVRSVVNYAYEFCFHIIVIMVVLTTLYMLYRCYVVPETIVKELSDLGFDHIPPGKDRERRVARAQTARPIDDKIPPPYPNGWFAVAESGGLRRGGILAVDALGHNLCVYRGEDGVARCVDAYCPHLGANLAVGGSVCGDCVECPFHGWRFRDGALVSVPGLEIVPKGVSIKTWVTAEADGAVWIWHDAEGRSPQWRMEDAPELTTFGYRGRNEFTVSCHIQEIPENGADIAHLNAVHGTSLLTRIGDQYPFLHDLIGKHYWTADWKKSEEFPHTANIDLTHDYKWMKMNLFHIDAKVTQNGPGHVHLRLSTPFGPVLISSSVTPVGPLKQKAVFRVFSPASNALVGWMLNRTEADMFERDVAIWNNKRYVGAPAYVKTDKTIRAFRAWYSQFYSPSSLSFREALQNPLDW